MKIDESEITHDPEEPSLHQGKRYPDSDILENMQEKDDRDPEGGVEIVEDKPKRSEEGLHDQEGQVNN